MKWSRHNRILLFLSFLEGGSLMAAELISARMLAPTFGSSIFVWASVLGVTLGALALGYYQGGVFSTFEKRDKILLSTLIASGILLILMPLTAQWVLNYAHLFPFRQAVLIAAIIIILPPVTGMGMVSPLMVANLDHSIESSGKRAGMVYTVSTTGGIVFTFLFGFYILPEFGLIVPSMITGFVLGLVPAILLFRHGWVKPGILGAVFLMGMSYHAWQAGLRNDKISVLYQEEGILGQVMVAEIPVERDGKTQTERTLFVNRIIQTSYNPENEKFNDFDYFHAVSDVLSAYPEGSRMLVLGLGGGVLAQDAVKKGFAVDAVELDQRIIDVSRQYFGLDTSVQVFRDDARRYLNACKETYDIILFDLFRGEETPAHVFTAESIAKTRSLLKPGGLVMINANGYFRGEIGKGTRSLYKTIRALGLYVELYPTDSLEERSNMIYLASNSRDTFDELLPEYMQEGFIPSDSIDIDNAIILTDRRPVLDHLNESATRRWRSAYLAYNKTFYQNLHIPMFN